MTADGLMTAAQAATLKRLAQDAYELDAFKLNLTGTEADIRIAMLTAKLKLLGEAAAYTLRQEHGGLGPMRNLFFLSKRRRRLLKHVQRSTVPVP